MATTAADILIDTIHDSDVDFVVDPFEPPMPAKVTLEQAAKLAESLVRGEPNRSTIALNVLRDEVKELLCARDEARGAGELRNREGCAPVLVKTGVTCTKPR